MFIVNELIIVIGVETCVKSIFNKGNNFHVILWYVCYKLVLLLGINYAININIYM